MSLENLYEQYADMLYRVSFSLLQNKADAEDAVMDVFERYLRARKRFVSSEHEKAWLLKVAVNRCRDLLRKKKFRLYTPLEEVTSLPAEEQTVFDFSAILSLPQEQKEVILLYYFEDMKVEEIGEVLSASTSAVKMRLVRARESLRERLGDEYEIRLK